MHLLLCLSIFRLFYRQKLHWSGATSPLYFQLEWEPSSTALSSTFMLLHSVLKKWQRERNSQLFIYDMTGWVLQDWCRWRLEKAERISKPCTRQLLRCTLQTNTWLLADLPVIVPLSENWSSYIYIAVVQCSGKPWNSIIGQCCGSEESKSCSITTGHIINGPFCERRTQTIWQGMPSIHFDVDFGGIFASLNEFKVNLWEVFYAKPLKRKHLCPANKALLVS